jgi:dCTP deaminase
MLSDRTIRKLLGRGDGTLGIESLVPLRDEQFQPASFDLRLGDVLGGERVTAIPEFDGELEPRGPAPGWWLPVHSFRLASTLERVRLGSNLAGRVEGKSSWARRGLMVHCAGFVDPGFRGQITLELFNLGPATVFLELGKRIAQICFDWVDTNPERIYGHPGLRSRYMDQHGPTPAKEWAG